MASLTTAQEKVLKLINEKELADLTVAMASITAPSDYEQPMADYVLQWLKSNGFDNSLQQLVCEDRSNTVGVLRGGGAGNLRRVKNSGMME